MRLLAMFKAILGESALERESPQKFSKRQSSYNPSVSLSTSRLQYDVEQTHNIVDPEMRIAALLKLLKKANDNESRMDYLMGLWCLAHYKSENAQGGIPADKNYIMALSDQQYTALTQGYSLRKTFESIQNEASQDGFDPSCNVVSLKSRQALRDAKKARAARAVSAEMGLSAKLLSPEKPDFIFALRSRMSNMDSSFFQQILEQVETQERLSFGTPFSTGRAKLLGSDQERLEWVQNSFEDRYTLISQDRDFGDYPEAQILSFGRN